MAFLEPLAKGAAATIAVVVTSFAGASFASAEPVASDGSGSTAVSTDAAADLLDDLLGDDLLDGVLG